MPNRWLLEAGMPNANLEAWGALPIVRRLQPPAEPTSDRGAGFETGCEVAPLETHCVSDGRNSALASISSRQGDAAGANGRVGRERSSGTATNSSCSTHGSSELLLAKPPRSSAAAESVYRNVWGSSGQAGQAGQDVGSEMHINRLTRRESNPRAPSTTRKINGHLIGG